MEFRIRKNEFLRGLRLAQSIADRKSTMPMLANVLLRIIGDGKLLVAATDLNVSVAADLPCETTGDGGLTIGARALYDVVVNMPGDQLVVRRADNHWAELSAGQVEYRLVGMPDRDFPKIPDHREASLVDVDASVLYEMIDKTLFSVCNDETRYHLNGVLFESDGDRALMVSTDGHRLSKCVRSLAGGPALPTGVIIPKKALVELKRTLDGVDGTCRLAVTAPYLFVQSRDITLAVKLIEADFPPYQQVVPTQNNHRLVIDRETVLGALKRAQLMSSDTRGVKFTLSEGALHIAGDNPDIGEVKEQVAAEYAGPDVSVGFNPKYVLELLSHMDTAQIAIELAGELDPGLIRPVDGDDYLGVVMPMRI